MAPAAAETLRIEILGSPRVFWGTTLVQPRVPLKTYALLGYLVLAGPAPVARETVAFAMWPDEPEEVALANLRRYLYRLTKHVLPNDAERWLSITSRSLALRADAPIEVDLFEIREAVSDLARAPDVLARYRGPLLEPIDEPWVIGQRRSLHESVFTYIARSIDAFRESDDEFALALATKATRLDPLDERPAAAIVAIRSARGDGVGAMREYRRYAELLASELDVRPSPEFTEAYERALAMQRSQPLVATAPELPARVDRTVGRTAEVDEIGGLISDNRLVTLTGAGGIGKTRLALEIAATLAPAFRDSVRFVDLSALADEASVARGFVAALELIERADLSPLSCVTMALRESERLLVVDNCEHVIAAAATIVAAILERCPGVSIITTSREPLHVAGEHVYRVPSLAIADAIELFVARASAAEPAFVADADALATIAEICRRLDGIALAIELAAGRVRVLGVAAIARLLDDRFRLLSGPSGTRVSRHRTVRALIDWSYDLLNDRERTLLRALAIFVGGWTLDAAASVVGDAIDEYDIIDTLQSLVDRSLVVADRENGDVRYRFLETVRAYALDRAMQCCEIESLAERHARYFAHASLARIEYDSSEWRAWLVAMVRDAENLRSALRWLVDAAHDVRLGAETVAALKYFWNNNARLEGLDWIERAERALGVASMATASSRTVAELLRTRCRLIMYHTDRGGTVDDVICVLRKLGAEDALAEELVNSGYRYAMMGAFDAARPPLEEALRIATRRNVRQIETFALGALAFLRHVERADVSRARRTSDEAIALGEERRYLFTLGPVYYCRVRIEWSVGAYEAGVDFARHMRGAFQRAGAVTGEAVGIAIEALALSRLGRDREAGTTALAAIELRKLRPAEVYGSPPAAGFDVIAIAAARTGAWSTAARLFGHIDAMTAREPSIAAYRSMTETPDSVTYRTRVAEILGSDGFAKSAAAGAAIDLATALDEARTFVETL